MPREVARQLPGFTFGPHHGAVLLFASWILLGAAGQLASVEAFFIAARPEGLSRGFERPLAPSVHLHVTFQGAARQEDGVAFE